MNIRNSEAYIKPEAVSVIYWLLLSGDNKEVRSKYVREALIASKSVHAKNPSEKNVTNFWNRKRALLVQELNRFQDGRYLKFAYQSHHVEDDEQSLAALSPKNKQLLAAGIRYLNDHPHQAKIRGIPKEYIIKNINSLSLDNIYISVEKTIGYKSKNDQQTYSYFRALRFHPKYKDLDVLWQELRVYWIPAIAGLQLDQPVDLAHFRIWLRLCVVLSAYLDTRGYTDERRQLFTDITTKPMENNEVAMSHLDSSDCLRLAYLCVDGLGWLESEQNERPQTARILECISRGRRFVSHIHQHDHVKDLLMLANAYEANAFLIEPNISIDKITKAYELLRTAWQTHSKDIRVRVLWIHSRLARVISNYFEESESALDQDKMFFSKFSSSDIFDYLGVIIEHDDLPRYGSNLFKIQEVADIYRRWAVDILRESERIQVAEKMAPYPVVDRLFEAEVWCDSGDYVKAYNCYIDVIIKTSIAEGYSSRILNKVQKGIIRTKKYISMKNKAQGAAQFIDVSQSND